MEQDWSEGKLPPFFLTTLAGVVCILNGGVMTTITDGEWIADLGAITCRNVLNNVEE